MEDDGASFCDWESVHNHGAKMDISEGESGMPQIVFELLPERFAAGSFEGVSSTVTSCSSASSFLPATHFDYMGMQSKQSLSSITSPYQYNSESDDDSSALLNNFEILSLSSGEVIRCKRCKYHNKTGSAICASCALALVANPNANIDNQIALNLAAKEEKDVRAMLLEAEQKRSRIYQHPMYYHASILANDITKAVCHSSFQTLSKEYLEEIVLRFVLRFFQLELPSKNISFAYKCTQRSMLEVVQTRGFPADQRFGLVKVSHNLKDALDYIETLEVRRGVPLCPIPESRADGSVDEQRSFSCLCWVVAIINSEPMTISSDNLHTCCSPTQVLPLAYFGSPSSNYQKLNVLLQDLQHTFQEFFVGSLEPPNSIMNNTPKSDRLPENKMNVEFASDTITDNNSQPSNKRRKTNWRCDVCLTAVFKDYNEAMEHEKQCENKKCGAKEAETQKQEPQKQSSMPQIMEMSQKQPQEKQAQGMTRPTAVRSPRKEQIAEGEKEKKSAAGFPSRDFPEGDCDEATAKSPAEKSLHRHNYVYSDNYSISTEQAIEYCRDRDTGKKPANLVPQLAHKKFFGSGPTSAFTALPPRVLPML